MNQAQNSNVIELIKQRKSIRKFSDKPVSREIIIKILEAGRWAPSGLNNQPWRFIVLLDTHKQKQDLAKCTKYGYVIEGAKALIVVFLDRESMYNYTKDCQAVGACIQNMLLTIHFLGLGGVWLGEILNQKEKVCEILDVDPNRYELMAVVAFGYPAEKGSSSRKEIKELLLKDL